MKNTIAFEAMPRLNATQFVEMLASNEHGSIDARAERFDTGQIPEWLDAVRNESQTTSLIRRKSPETRWKASTILRGLLLSAHNATQSPLSPPTTQSRGIATTDIDHAQAPFFSYPVDRLAGSLPYEKDLQPNLKVKKNVLNYISISTAIHKKEKNKNLKNQTHRLVDRQIASVKILLRKHGIGASESVLADHPTLVNDVVTYIQQDPSNLSQVAKRLCKTTHEYGGRRNETLIESRQHAIVDNWLAELYFEDSLFTVVTDLLCRSPTVRAASPPERYVENIRHRLTDKLGSLSLSLTQLNYQAKAYLREKAIDKIFPALTWQPIDAEAFGRVKVGTLEWGFIQAGLHIAADLGIDIAGWSTYQAKEMGEMLGVLVREGAAPEEWSGYFAIPARLYAISQGLESSEVTSSSSSDFFLSDALRRFHEDALAEYYRNEPTHKLVTALKSYQTRPQLAEATLAERCPNIRDRESLVTSYLNAEEVFCPTGHVPTRFEELGNLGIVLPNITTLFKEQNKHIAALLADVDRLLLPLAFGAIDEAEKHFIERAIVQRAEAKFDAAHTRMGTITGTKPYDFKAFTKHLPSDIELFSARDGDEERIYALYKIGQSKKNDSGPDAAHAVIGYKVERVDRNETRYRELLDVRTREYIERGGNYALDVKVSGRILKQSADSPEALYARIRKDHSVQMERALHKRGYEETTREKVSSFLWDLVPFYSCATGIARGEAIAVLPCALDIVSLIPLAGQAAAMTTRFGVAASTVGITSLRQAVAQAGIRGVLTQSGRIVQRAGAAGLETLSENAFKHLSTNALRALDPGIELISMAGRVALRQTSKLLDNLRSIYPSANVLSKALASRAEAAKVLVPSVITQKASFPGVSQQFDVVAIGHQQGREAFVRINPATGDRFGTRYYLDADGALTRFVPPLRERLKIIADQGMSGRGAMKAGASMAHRHRHRHGDVANEVGQEDRLPGAQGPQHGGISAQGSAVAPPPSMERGKVSSDTYQDYARRVVANPGEPPVKILDLPKYELEEVFSRCHLNDLASLSKVTKVTRETVHDVINYKWPKERLWDELKSAVRADQSQALSLLVAEGVKIPIRPHSKSIVSEALRLQLSTPTYSALLRIAANVNGDIVRLTSRGSKLDFLQAAIYINNPNAINAVLNFPLYKVIPEHAQISLAIYYRRYEALQALMTSGKFDPNKKIIGLSPLMVDLRIRDGDTRFTEYLLSHRTVDVRSGYVIDASAELDRRKYRMVLQHPETDVNALYQHPQSPISYTTPLFSAIDRAFRIPFARTNFDMLLRVDRLDVNKKVLVPDRGSMSAIEYVKNYHPNEFAAFVAPLKSALINALRQHPSYINRPSCTIC